MTRNIRWSQTQNNMIEVKNYGDHFGISYIEENHPQHPGISVTLNEEELRELHQKISEAIAALDNNKKSKVVVWNPRSGRHEIKQ